MSLELHAIECDEAPSLAPEYINQHWTDTSTNTTYLSTGTATVADWKAIIIAPRIKSGAIDGTTFTAGGGGKLEASVLFANAFIDNNYSITGSQLDVRRRWEITNKSATGFTVKSHSDDSFTGFYMWQAIKFGEN